MHRKGDVRERFVKRYVVRNEKHTILDDIDVNDDVMRRNTNVALVFDVILDDIDVNDDVKNKRYICVATHEKHGSCRRPAEGK